MAREKGTVPHKRGTYRRRHPYRRKWTLWQSIRRRHPELLILPIFALVAWLYQAWPDTAQKFGSFSSASPQDIAGRASAIDGDTFEIHGQRIRLWGVDAPESAQLCHVSGKPWRCGQQAALAVSDHIGQRTVACIEQDRDRYGRIVARCSVAAEDIGAWLVGNGWALDYTEYSGGAYASHQAIAARAKIGIWRGTFDKPWEWRRAN